MNSEKQLYEELLREHPELKESKIDILEVITLMKQVNPDIVADADYKTSLKERLDTIAQYNPQKSHVIFGFLKYFIPVFSFGFAVFGFIYFSEEFNPSTTYRENPEILSEQSSRMAPESMMMLSDMADENILETIPENIEKTPSGESMMKIGGYAMLKSNENIDSSDVEIDNLESMDIQFDDIPEDILEESMPMMFSMESIMEDSPNMDMRDLQSTGTGELNYKIIKDIFQEICGEYNGLIKVMEDEDRICVLENINCLESTYIETECFTIK